MRYIPLLFMMVTCSLTSSLQGDDRLSAQQVMTPQDMQAIGVNKFTPEQRAAFEQWLTTWTHHVLEQAPSYRPGQNLPSWVQGWPSYANPTKSKLTPDELQLKQQSNQIIDKVRDNGQYVDLRNGSSWLISPVFRYLTTTWQRNQVIEIYKGQNELHPWILQNISANQSAQANMSKPPSPSGTKEPESPDYFKGSVGLQSVTEQGDFVSLADGTIWKIGLKDLYKARTWKPSDRIRVEKSGDFLYNYRLTNLDTGEAVLANPKK